MCIGADLGEPWRDEEGKIIPRFIEDIAARSDAYKQLAARYPNNPDSVNYYLNKPHKVNSLVTMVQKKRK